MKLKALTKLLCYLLLSFGAVAQNNTTPNAENNQENGKPAYLRNIVKMNLSSLAFNNYNFSYERLVARKTSVLLGYRYMPKTNLADLKLSDRLIRVADDEGLEEDLDRISAGNNTVTAEVRFYTGKKDGAKGFYFGLYGRYAGFTTDYLYEYTTSNKTYDVPLQAKYNGVGGGLVMGAQFALAKRVMIDLYVLGAHYGKLNGDINADMNLGDLTPQQRQELQNELNDVFTVGDRSFVSTTVSSRGVTGKIDGPFAGVRGLGLTVGFAF